MVRPAALPGWLVMGWVEDGVGEDDGTGTVPLPEGVTDGDGTSSVEELVEVVVEVDRVLFVVPGSVEVVIFVLVEVELATVVVELATVVVVEVAVVLDDGVGFLFSMPNWVEYWYLPSTSWISWMP